MKLCKYCNKYFPELDFGVANTIRGKIYRRLKCRYCFSDAKKVLKEKYRKFLDGYKEKHGCHKCGIKDRRVLDFHHLRDKEFSIGYANYNHLAFNRVKKEIEKCAVVCSNCHRIIHYKQYWQHDKQFRNYKK
ncbi:MAG: hypothetical protein A2908_04340 [Candidatus Staskawiczbacteria bacterium RIFCSPLOWO2_01_FULL_38_12b]|uniref:Uncharacterized protein n=1 Tax=Candidatus Staskawiczbacteria bacterium RIFCSPLOWO2_01_FULL_38_12b TaxID=1802214 RepID=A0A1G2IBG2_9BACT|nr:MAG: hypothetical protein A2908_04340 [Candidatus Staskawiczbacteria bacterium RIFCSPLOWO2_01_FULL_38_12b]